MIQNGQQQQLNIQQMQHEKFKKFSELSSLGHGIYQTSKYLMYHNRSFEKNDRPKKD